MAQSYKNLVNYFIIFENLPIFVSYFFLIIPQNKIRKDNKCFQRKI